MMIFKDRQSAGKLLAKRLKEFRDKPNILVLGIPRGGVVVAYEIAKKLRLPLDIVVTRKIGAPFQSELALGAVDADGEVVWDQALLDQFQISNIKDQLENEMGEIKRREELYRQGREPLDVESKIVILVDDGIATGATVLAAARFLKRHKAERIILAVPVASRESINKINQEVDGVEVLNTPDFLQAVGQFYQNFEEVSDEKVIELLNK